MLCLLHQENSVVAAVRHNALKVHESLKQAAKQKARLVITSELCLIGYPPRDLLAFPQLYLAEKKQLELLRSATKEIGVALLIGHLEKAPENGGNYFFNAASLYDKGQVQGVIRKQRLPNYDVFEEDRFFGEWLHPQENLELDGIKLGVFICEDAWDSSPAFGRSDIKQHTDASAAWPRLQKADLLVNLSASPYSLNKRPLREKVFQEKAAELNKPLIYVNTVGAQDDIIFDGGSFVCSPKGTIIAQARTFQSDSLIVNPFQANPSQKHQEYRSWEELKQALCLGIADYSRKNRITKAILGLSGGIDSALVAALAVDALGANNVEAHSLPTRFTSKLSRELSKSFAKRLGIQLHETPLDTTLQNLAPAWTIPENHLAHENLQARLRGVFLMSQANLQNALLLTTCNKSETAMGYTTLYGDMCGTLSPIADLYKTEVYGLCHYINLKEKDLFSQALLDRAPTAELKTNQVDADSLPPYPILDTALEDILENQALLFQSDHYEQFKKDYKLNELFNRVFQNEFKRQQSAPILKIHGRAFGSGWRFPISKDLSDF